MALRLKIFIACAVCVCVDVLIRLFFPIDILRGLSPSPHLSPQSQALTTSYHISLPEPPLNATSSNPRWSPNGFASPLIYRLTNSATLHIPYSKGQRYSCLAIVHPNEWSPRAAKILRPGHNTGRLISSATYCKPSFALSAVCAHPPCQSIHPLLVY